MNTISTESGRRKYFSNTFNQALRNMLVAEKICLVDHTDSKTIDNPYGSQPTTTIQTLTGTYTPAAYTITDDTLTVTDEFIISEHVYDFEKILTVFDLYASRMDEMMASASAAIDKWVVNNLCEDGTGTYTTPAGGFTNPSNWGVILANLIAKVSGYADIYRGLYIVIENSDLVGLIQTQIANGFNYADAALNNGYVDSMLGVQIYVIRDGTFVDATLGTKTVTNSGHRVFGVKNMATYAAPRGLVYEEKAVSGKTGRELMVVGYVGFAAWVPKRALTIDITIA